ncbi:hypothetical protein [Brevundimonas subvibrioides]|uniref:Lipoprotein n=1 Tax=Brevundimonas subvibrioides (strain ATCC 15264 / DSM 4735 / LMG 14903 / NBRC 16000 / CB 81) TaxID=633149 RepID=D9QHZ6_BRESC|nr:hypothetical protein [Brevundimonas subvibrioides]ADL01254.1 hypothetical protein Bresu_1943 [Brevundimonas subvibrioides ATCC 15264]
MRRALILTVAAVALAACGEPAETAATPAEKVAATAPVSDAVAQSPAVLTAVDLRRVCRAGLAAIHGQQLADIELTGLEGQVVNAQWRAPVDGGIMKAQCRAGDGLVVWKPLDLPDPEAVRWMDQAGDAVVRYVIRGEEIEITQTLPDGTTQQAMMPVRAEEEVS